MAPFILEELVVLDQTDEKPNAALIFLHGASHTGHDVKENVQKYLNSDGHPYIKCYFPTAPERYFTIRDMQVTVVNGSTTPLLSLYGLKDEVLTPSMMEATVQLFSYKKIRVSVKHFQHLGHDLDLEYTKCMFEWMEQLLPRIS